MKLSSFSQLSSPQQFKNCCRSVQPAAIKRVFHPNRADDRVLYLITQSMRMSVVQDGRKGSWPELRHNSGVYFESQNNDDKRVSGTFRTRSGRMRSAPRSQNCPLYNVPFIMSPSTEAISHRNPVTTGHSVTAAVLCDTKKTDTLYSSTETVVKTRYHCNQSGSVKMASASTGAVK